jgi:uncharacterized membrane protein
MGEAITWGWERFSENAALLVAAQVVVWVVPGFVEFVGTSVAFNALMESLVGLATLIVSLVLQLGVINLTLRIHDGKPVEFAHLLDQVDRIGWFILATWLMAVAIVLGLLLFIIPGVVIGIRLMFVGQVIVDERVNTLDAFQRSWDITRGFGFDLFLFALLVFAINLLGFILLGVGLLVTLPVTALAAARVFRHLQSRYNDLAAQPRAAS